MAGARFVHRQSQQEVRAHQPRNEVPIHAYPVLRAPGDELSSKMTTLDQHPNPNRHTRRSIGRVRAKLVEVEAEIKAITSVNTDEDNDTSREAQIEANVKIRQRGVIKQRYDVLLKAFEKMRGRGPAKGRDQACTLLRGVFPASDIAVSSDDTVALAPVRQPSIEVAVRSRIDKPKYETVDDHDDEDDTMAREPSAKAKGKQRAGSADLSPPPVPVAQFHHDDIDGNDEWVQAAIQASLVSMRDSMKLSTSLLEVCNRKL